MTESSCKCGTLISNEWVFCPTCGRRVRSRLNRWPLIFIVLFFIFGFVISERFLGETPKYSLSNIREQFNLALKVGDYQKLENLVLEISKKKMYEISPEERLVLVDSLTVLSKIYPDNVEIKYNLGLASFIFGAFSKAYEIFSELEDKVGNKEDVRILKILSLVGLNDYQAARNLLLESSLSDKNYNFVDAFIKFKQGYLSADELKNFINPNSKSDYFLIPFLTKVTGSREFDLIKWFHDHEIIGPKIIGHSVRGNKLILELDNFPIYAMPADVLDNLKMRIKEELKKSSIETVEFYSNNQKILDVGK